MKNLKHGEAAPETGTYVCCFCGPGGIAEITVIPMKSLRSGGGPLKNADFMLPVSKRLTVYTITEGANLPQCPTCGKATGWDLLTGTLEDLLRRRVEGREAMYSSLGITRSEPIEPGETALDRLTIITDETKDGVPCDVCNRRIPANAGYLLATPKVVASEAYWCHAFRVDAAQIDGLPDRATQERYFAARIGRVERDRTPWRVCDDCTELFAANWTTAREHVLRSTKPRGPGRFRSRLRVADYVLPAARAWTRERGWWPASVVPPEEVVDRCDLCEKPVWKAEPVSFHKPDAIEGWIRAGVLAMDPAQPPRQSHGEPGWMVCLPCFAGLLSRLYRLNPT